MIRQRRVHERAIGTELVVPCESLRGRGRGEYCIGSEPPTLAPVKDEVVSPGLPYVWESSAVYLRMDALAVVVRPSLGASRSKYLIAGKAATMPE